MDASFCVEALNEATAKYGKPEIFNTDQGSQFTSFEFTGALKDAGGGLRLRATCGDVDKARALPTSPQAQQQQQVGFIMDRVLAA